MSIETILAALNRYRLRATYGAVGKVLGLPAISVGARLGTRRPEASWVVAKSTGLPTGYHSHEYNPELFQSDRIIDSAEELQALLPE